MKNIPASVYHLQLSKNFPLKKAIQLIPYLCELGVEGICCSPLFASFSNGYDVTNPNLFNPD
jgi:maltooligosyltrehalose synthase